MFLPLICKIAELHGDAIQHDLNIEISFLLLLHYVNHVSGDPLSGAFRVHQNIMHIGHQFTIIEESYHISIFIETTTFLQLRN